MSDRWHNNNMQQNPANEWLDTVKSPFVESPMAIDKAMSILGKSYTFGQAFWYISYDGQWVRSAAVVSCGVPN